MRTEPLEPRRIRHPRGAYGWVDLRIVTGGYLEALDPTVALAYLFLCTVGNREGVSYWSRARMARTLNLPRETVDAALRALVAADLIAATDRIVQVLPVPDRYAITHAQQIRTPPPASTPSVPTVADSDVSEAEILAHEPAARARIARFNGARDPSASVVRAVARSMAAKARA